MTVHQCWYSRNEKLRPAFNKNNYCVSDIACGHSYRIISVILRTHHEFVDKNSRTSCTVELSLFMYLMVGSAREWPRFLRSEATITAVSYANASFFLLPSLCCVFSHPPPIFLYHTILDMILNAGPHTYIYSNQIITGTQEQNTTIVFLQQQQQQ